MKLSIIENHWSELKENTREEESGACGKFIKLINELELSKKEAETKKILTIIDFEAENLIDNYISSINFLFKKEYITYLKALILKNIDTLLFSEFLPYF